MKLDMRFWSKVAVGGEDECWLWKASVNSGRGQFSTGGRPRKAHRLSYVHFYGPVPKGKEVCHTCDVGTCVNPKHLFAGTHAENMRDMKEKGRANGGGPSGESHWNAKLSNEDVASIRARAASGEKHKEIARSFGVCNSTIGLIKAGKIWKTTEGA